MCIEFVSDSRRSEIELDTKVKFAEFEYIKVKEYFLFSGDKKNKLTELAEKHKSGDLCRIV